MLSGQARAGQGGQGDAGGGRGGLSEHNERGKRRASQGAGPPNAGSRCFLFPVPPGGTLVSWNTTALRRESTASLNLPPDLLPQSTASLNLPRSTAPVYCQPKPPPDLLPQSTASLNLPPIYSPSLLPA